MKLLSIGNSFSVDAQRYLHALAKAGGTEITTANLYIGGCPLSLHYRNMLGDFRAYTLYFNGEATPFDLSIKEALLSASWDVVTLQQASHESFRPDSFVPYITELADFVRKCCPKAKVIIHQTWAYEDGSERLAKMGFDTGADMFRQIEKAYDAAAESIRADGILPAGEMFQHLLARGIEKVHRDTFHASYGLGRYALALLWYRLLTGKSAMDNPFCDFDEPVSEEEIRIAKEYVESLHPISF